MSNDIYWNRLKNNSPAWLFVCWYFAWVEDPHRADLQTIWIKYCIRLCIKFSIFFEFRRSVHHTDLIQTLYIFYSRIPWNFLLGLVFSFIGDALCYLDFLSCGMAAFAVAQICYKSAFGCNPFIRAFILLFICECLYMLGPIVINIDNPLDNNFITLIAMGSFMYMCWRALVRVSHKKDYLSIIFEVMGIEYFVVSDMMIIINMFTMEIPYHRIWIIFLYGIIRLSNFFCTTDTRKARKLSYRIQK